MLTFKLGHYDEPNRLRRRNLESLEVTETSRKGEQLRDNDPRNRLLKLCSTLGYFYSAWKILRVYIYTRLCLNVGNLCNNWILLELK